jgi:hypothetical protein
MQADDWEAPGPDGFANPLLSPRSVTNGQNVVVWDIIAANCRSSSLHQGAFALAQKEQRSA